MLLVPPMPAMRFQQTVSDVGTQSFGASVSTGGTNTTKTATPVELVASTAFDTFLVQIWAGNYGSSATTSRGCLDIMVGGSGSEIVLIPDLLMGFCGNLGGAANPGPKRWVFPLFVPAGTRISARVAGDRTSTAMRVAIELIGGVGYPPFPVGSKVVTYGVTVPAGTNLTPGASAVEGAWAEMTASTSEDHFCIVPSAQPPTGDTTLTASSFNMDVGIGAATEEVVAGGGRQMGWHWNLDGNELVGGPYNLLPFVLADIPAGSRLAARMARSSAADTVATWNAALHCVSR